PFLVQSQGAPAIAHLDYGEWLDEQRRPAGRLIVHDAWHRAAELRAHRNYVAPRTLCHDRVLDGVAERRRTHELSQAGHQPIVGTTQLGADATQRRAGAVQDFAALADRIRNVLGEPRMIAQETLHELE